MPKYLPTKLEYTKKFREIKIYKIIIIPHNILLLTNSIPHLDYHHKFQMISFQLKSILNVKKNNFHKEKPGNF